MEETLRPQKGRLTTTPDIIALLIISVFMIAGFFGWEHYVEARTTRPPLMRLGLWTRARGKLAATYLIGGISWMGFTTMFYNATLFYQVSSRPGQQGESSLYTNYSLVNYPQTIAGTR